MESLGTASGPRSTATVGDSPRSPGLWGWTLEWRCAASLTQTLSQRIPRREAAMARSPAAAVALTLLGLLSLRSAGAAAPVAMVPAAGAWGYAAQRAKAAARPGRTAMVPRPVSASARAFKRPSANG